MSFFLPLLGFIGGWIFKKYKHTRNAKACFKGARIGLATLGVIILFFCLMLLLAVIYLPFLRSGHPVAPQILY